MVVKDFYKGDLVLFIVFKLIVIIWIICYRLDSFFLLKYEELFDSIF